MSDTITEINSEILEKDVDELSDAEILERIVTLGFDGDWELYNLFRDKLKAGLPAGTGVALRGSVVTNKCYEDGKPFDAKGEDTSDLDVTLIGERAREMWNADAYYIPALHTKPLGDTIQTILDAGYVDGFRRLYPNDKGYTFPVWQPHVRLDYIFLPSERFGYLKSCEVVKQPHSVRAASDHFPLLAHLKIEDE